MNNIRYDLVPVDYMAGAVQRYIENRIDPGSFLASIICNDLTTACGKADSTNQQYLVEWVKWFYNEAPNNCWGSREKYIAWIERKESG